jgi:hypothetical protein
MKRINTQQGFWDIQSSDGNPVARHVGVVPPGIGKYTMSPAECRDLAMALLEEANHADGKNMFGSRTQERQLIRDAQLNQLSSIVKQQLED